MRNGLGWIPRITFAAAVTAALGLGVTQAFANPLLVCGDGGETMQCDVNSCGSFCAASYPAGSHVGRCLSNACCACESVVAEA
ncbi:MAG TPA: hypothetical protein VF615_15100 [Longimicrobiaceae bacterium]|jgi:hypothetical protein